MQLVNASPPGIQAQGVYLHQFVLHAALDAVNEQLWTTTSMHLGNVDKFNNLMVAAYVTAAHVKFLLLHDGKNDEAIRLFFKDVYDIYVRVSHSKECKLPQAVVLTPCKRTSDIPAGLHESLFHDRWACRISWIRSESPDSCQDSFPDIVWIAITIHNSQ